MVRLQQSGGRVGLQRLASVAISAAILCFGLAFASSAVAATFNPTLVISDDNMRAYDSMSQADIQAFLATQSGPLKSLVTTDYAGVKKPASQIIAEACRQWHISPKVMLALLQKEQSLLTRTSLLKNTLSRAIGAGCPNGSTNKYPGFGKQMWYGARLLDGYGEGKNGSTIALWKAPYTVVTDIYQHPNVAVKTANVSTYKLYIYNPSIGAKTPYGDLSSQSSNLSGNANFWMIYRKNFGDPFAPPSLRPVFRLRNAKNGAYIYTTSQAERYNLVRAGTWKYERTPFSWDTSASANSRPVARFYNRKNGAYFYTASAKSIRLYRSASKSRTWRYQGTAFYCSGKVAGATPVYGFVGKSSGTVYLTAALGEKSKMLSAANRKKWTYWGVVFYMAHH